MSNGPQYFVIIIAVVLMLSVSSLATVRLIEGQNVFQVTLHAVDVNSMPVEWPVLFSISGWGNVTAYQNGTVTLNLPSGQYHVSAEVFGIQVGAMDITVDKSLDAVVPSNLYSLKVTVANLPGNYSSAAFAYAYFGVGGVENVSLSSSMALFKQLPAAPISVFVTGIDGTPLANGQMALSQNGELTAYYSKFFHITVRVVDASEQPVVGALVSLGVLTNTTDVNGTASIFAPAGSLPIQVTFLGVSVSADSLQIAKDSSLQLTVNVGKLQALILDELGQPLAGRDIAVGIGGWQATVRTDSGGYLAVQQMPYGTVVLRVLPNGLETSVAFPLPQTARSIQLFTGPLVMQADVLSAVMFGSMKVKVTVKMGALAVKNASLYVNGQPAQVSSDGVISVPVGLEWEPRATVTVKAYGVTRSVTVSAAASPIPLLTLPIAFLPLLVWRLMVLRYRRRMVPLA